MATARLDRKGLAEIPCRELTDQELIGEGGFGKVYRAKHRILGRVAYKKLLTTHVDQMYAFGL